MVFSFHSKKRDVDAKHLKRLHKTVPFIQSPLQGVDLNHLVFSQRHEANTVELFFDLFFVANLATFTTYHSITDVNYLTAYIGFFGILWSSWFQVTLHDVRFARDSIYERVCKMIQFIVFVGLALVGSSFTPGSKKGTNTTFRILCYTLVISRVLLAIQYCVVLFYTWRAKFSKLYLPLGIMIGLYALATGVFGAMTPAFREEEHNHRHIYMIWYVVIVIEAVAVIAVSSIWRTLSFKKTHLMERMSLLTLIVIGEGAIGVTKTVSRLMGKYGLEFEGCALIMGVIIILVLLWALYFDNFPHGHYGTIRQQIWSLLHFPCQLAIVGIVEGSQQVVLARYVIKTWVKILEGIIKACYEENQDGQTLENTLFEMLEYFNFEAKAETVHLQAKVMDKIYEIGNMTGICSTKNTTDHTAPDELPVKLDDMMLQLFDGVYVGLGMKLPVDKRDTASSIAVESWRLVYMYYWISFCLFIMCSIAFLVLIRRHRADLFDYISIGVRLIVLAVGGALIALISNENGLYSFLASPAVLPTCLILLFLVILFDRLSAAFCNWHLKRSGEPHAEEYSEAHQEGHDPDHGQAVHATGHAHHGSTAHGRMVMAESGHGDREPLTAHGADTGYYGAEQSYPMTPMSPPVVSPKPLGGEIGSHGFAPIAREHYSA
ncbi:hypothetical protein DM02DRAFT_651805 [Periconia macrospinosa]|uniref:Low temperature requirement A n=1 Tax=Periconia macrospinosa TaxID=97972 RepID=A0A2V1E4Q0_9PLEO|nr:hypothetical protein DM02DRAFT_651805 [Periconia macrospinosa]